MWIYSFPPAFFDKDMSFKYMFVAKTVDHISNKGIQLSQTPVKIANEEYKHISPK